MKPEFICHKDFAAEYPKNMFHKEEQQLDLDEKDEKYLNRHILFRKKLFLESIEGAILKISADDYYKLYINGKFVTMGPAPSYPQCYNYNEIDVTPYLTLGENTFAVHTYYQGLINRVWVSADRRQMLWFDLSVGGKTVAISDSSWKCAEHSGYSAVRKIGHEVQFMECYDSRAAEKSFFAPDFDDSAWESASVYENADYTLVRQTTEQIETYRLDPMIIERRGNTLYLDFGRETVGYLCARAKGKDGDELVLHYGEELNEDGSVRYKLRCNCFYEEKWILADGESELDQYDYKAFRYAEIDLPDGVQIEDVYMLVRHYPCIERAGFDADTPELEAIVRLCADTVKYGMQENFVDCPTREKGQYLGDVSVAARAHAVLTGDTTMMKKAIADFCHSCFICDGMMAVSTSSLMQEIADYSLQFPAQVLWVYKTDGDLEFLRFAAPYVKRVYNYFLRYEREDGLIEGVCDKWNLVDWPANLRDGYDFPLTRPIGDGVHNVLNAFWCGFLQATDEICRILGIEETGKTERAIDSFIKCFYSEESGLFCDSVEHTHSAVHSNILPLLFGIGSRECHARIVELIERKGLSSMGVYMAYFALASLKVRGEYELAKRLICDPACWLNMLSEGATTTFEAWGKDQKWNTSLFHPWATAPLIILSKNTLAY